MVSLLVIMRKFANLSGFRSLPRFSRRGTIPLRQAKSGDGGHPVAPSSSLEAADIGRSQRAHREHRQCKSQIFVEVVHDAPHLLAIWARPGSEGVRRVTVRAEACAAHQRALLIALGNCLSPTFYVSLAVRAEPYTLGRRTSATSRDTFSMAALSSEPDLDGARSHFAERSHDGARALQQAARRPGRAP